MEDINQKLPSTSIQCEEWANAKPSRNVDLPTFFA